jgi:hypothetical protein
MNTASKKHQMNRSVDRASHGLKSGIDFSAKRLKEFGAIVIDFAKQASQNTRRMAKNAATDTGEALEKTGKSLKDAARKNKKVA